MLSSVTVALAMLTVAADPASKPATVRLTDYVRKSEVKTASSGSESVRTPVRMAQAPVLAPSHIPSGTGSGYVPGSFGPTPGGYGAPSFGETIVEGPVEFGGPGCSDCGPAGCSPYRHRHVSMWSLHGLPGVWHSPGDMHQHVPYLAMPKNYYYFRPYQWFHIPEQQAEVTSYGGDPRHPYANREFQEIYQEFETPPVVPSYEVGPER